MSSLGTRPIENQSAGCRDRTAQVTAELAALAAGTRNWLIGNLIQLHPSHSQLDVTPRVKFGLEISLLRMLWSRWRPDDHELAALTEVVCAIWADPQFPELMLGCSARYSRQYGVLGAALAPADADGPHRAALADLAPTGYVAGYGKMAHLRLERRYYADLAGLAHDYESYRQLYERSILVQGLRVAELELQQAYEVTHAFFHLFDYGDRQLELSADERAGACRLIEEMIDHFVAIQHWDLIAECLTCLCCLGIEPAGTAAGAAAVESLRAVQLPSGALPGTSASRRVDPSTTPLEFFEGAFHVTLVTAMAAMQALGRTDDW
jgi:hypothetical protein